MENVGLSFFNNESWPFRPNSKRESLTRVLGGGTYNGIPQMKWYVVSGVSFHVDNGFMSLKKECCHCDNEDGIEYCKKNFKQVECGDFFKDFYALSEQMQDALMSIPKTETDEVQEGKYYLCVWTFEEDGTQIMCGRCVSGVEGNGLDGVSVDYDEGKEECSLSKLTVYNMQECKSYEVSQKRYEEICAIYDGLVGAYYDKYFAPAKE